MPSGAAAGRGAVAVRIDRRPIGGRKGILWIGGLIGVDRRKSFVADGEDRNADGEDEDWREDDLQLPQFAVHRLFRMPSQAWRISGTRIQSLTSDSYATEVHLCGKLERLWNLRVPTSRSFFAAASRAFFRHP
jgi:hypothetical protein